MSATDCPHCGASGTPTLVQRECRRFFKSDCDCRCAECGHEHDEDACSGSIGGQPWKEPCNCPNFVAAPTPCEKWKKENS